METALYPGTFDPVTNGHLDVLARACRLFERVVLAVADNPSKGSLFSAQERLQLVKDNLGDAYPGASVTLFDGLVVELAHQVGAKAIIRGLRAISDFDYEFQMAQMNRHLDDALETLFLMPNEKYFFTSSSLIKQVANYTDRDTGLVPDNVRHALAKRLAPKN